MHKAKQDGFRGHEGKERKIMAALMPILDHNAAEVMRLFDIIKQQAEY